jgi:hypothetical protein
VTIAFGINTAVILAVVSQNRATVDVSCSVEPWYDIVVGDSHYQEREPWYDIVVGDSHYQERLSAAMGFPASRAAVSNPTESKPFSNCTTPSSDQNLRSQISSDPSPEEMAMVRGSLDDARFTAVTLV